MRSFYIVAAVLVAMFWASCNVINPPEKIPTYVHIDSFAFRQPLAGQGSASHDITSVFVYYNNNPVGFFDLPVTFPVITSGDSGMITVSPAVTVNGLYNFQSTYQYYTFDSMRLRTNPGKDTIFRPVTGYNSAAHFPWMDDFESGNAFLTGTGGELVLDNNPADVFEGAGCGRIDMKLDSTFQIAAQKSFSMNPNGLNYLEFNYKCSTPFEVGVQVLNSSGGDATVYLVGANPNPNGWKKMYVSIQTVAQQYPNGQYYIIIKSDPPATAGTYILLDNLKVVGDQ